jgi:hypothetical protein
MADDKSVGVYVDHGSGTGHTVRDSKSTSLSMAKDSGVGEHIYHSSGTGHAVRKYMRMSDDTRMVDVYMDRSRKPQKYGQQ